MQTLVPWNAAARAAAQAKGTGVLENARIFAQLNRAAADSQIAQEVDDARVWGGIHFRTADVAGRALGRRVGELAVQNFPRPVR